MPSAWEGSNLTHNLGVLAGLAGRPVGTKLKYDSAAGKFDVDDRRLISRTFSSDSVTSDSHFAAPMRGLLLAAQGRAVPGTPTQADLDNAVAGLLRLRTTYAGTAAKVQSLDRVLKSVAGAVSSARETTGNGAIVVALRNRHLRNLVYAVRQRSYLDPGQGDVCHAFVIDWGRRVLTRKPSYGFSGKTGVAYESTATLSRPEHARMEKKMIRVAALQAEERPRFARGEGPRRSFPGDPKFGGVRLTGDATMKVGKFPRTATGRAVFEAVVAAGRGFAAGDGERVLMVQLDGATEAGSHMLGLHLSGVGLRDVHLFDPNVGEFRFTSAAEALLWSFCDDLMASLYTESRGLLFDSWVVTRISVVAERA